MAICNNNFPSVYLVRTFECGEYILREYDKSINLFERGLVRWKWELLIYFDRKFTGGINY